jgi:hypothetical protein
LDSLDCSTFGRGCLYLQGRGCAGRRGVTGGGEVAELEKLPKFPKKSHQNLKAV